MDNPIFRGVDPLAVFPEWFGPSRGLTKPALEPSMYGYDPRRLRVFRASHGKRRLSIDPVASEGPGVTIAFTLDGSRAQTTDLAAFDPALLRAVMPMRDFARRLSQHNKPVAPWLHTVGHHVGAESHHERTLMMLADYHPAVEHISGQPFTLVGPKGSLLNLHTPDVALLSSRGRPLIVDVRSLAGAAEERWVAKVPEEPRELHRGQGAAIVLRLLVGCCS